MSDEKLVFIKTIYTNIHRSSIKKVVFVVVSNHIVTVIHLFVIRVKLLLIHEKNDLNYKAATCETS